MKRLYLIFSFIISFSIFSYSQGTAGSNAKFEYRKLVDMQTAGVLEKGYVAVTSNVMPYGIFAFSMEVGVFENLSFGISYGAENVIGVGDMIGYKYPGVNIKYRLINESKSMPALAIGFNSQGTGKFYKDLNRYDFKSDGFFLAASKNFSFLGYLSLHGEVNYTLEKEEGEKDINLKIGIEKTIGEMVSLVVEYDFAVNDNGTYSLGDGKGYLNAGLHVSLGKGFTFGIDLRDMLQNKKVKLGSAERGIYFEYITPVFN